MMSEMDVESRVNYHAPTPEGVMRHRELAKAISDAMNTVDMVCPNGREKALAVTKLEEAKMWASAAVARNMDTV